MNLQTNLALPIEKLKNVGSRNAPRLSRLGIKTLKDLLWHIPTRYEDYTETVQISDIAPNEKVNIQGEVIRISTKKIFPRRLFITDAIVKDLSGAVRAVWFNQPFIENQLPEGTFVSLAGKVKIGKNGLHLASPTYEKLTYANSGLKHTTGLVPVYPETEGVTSKYLRFLIRPLLTNLEINDPLPKNIIEKYKFPVLSEAIKNIHFPQLEKDSQIAKERLAFDDLMIFQLKALLERRKMNQLKSVSIPFDKTLVQEFISKLPFELTTDQKISLWEILKDIQKNYPMNRLLEGDVGSGKTVVALAAAYQIAKYGYQTVLMVPTEVLAQQHYKTLGTIINDGSINTGLLIASEAKLNGESVNKKVIKEKIASGEVDIVIGTHAVIQKDVSFSKLALVVIDEQHRFGVSQRATLLKNKELGIKYNESEKTLIHSSKFVIPHLLSMTATPIPRTLALTIYGDLDISLIKEKPKNRQKIITQIYPPSQRKEAYQFVRSEVKNGKQIFVVCPRIELDTEAKTKNVVLRSAKGKTISQMKLIWQDVKAVEEEYKKLSEVIFPDLKVAMIHGKLKPKEKNETMNMFRGGWYDILVSTSVIEVGVDVPNATIMAIESAERFGLAQLHQFRGRVGRGESQSYCLLFSSTEDQTINRRLNALVECDDGFELAEKDMSIRGPGEFTGTKQSGLPDLAMASLANVGLIKKARLEARLLLKEDPSLSKYPSIQERLNEFQKITHFE